MVKKMLFVNTLQILIEYLTFVAYACMFAASTAVGVCLLDLIFYLANKGLGRKQ